MPQPELHRALARFNTQWETGEVSDLVKRNAARRRSFPYLRKRIEKLPWEVLAGPRQVGKTTLLGHLMEDLIQNGHPRETVLYAPLDSPPIALELGEHLQPLVETYERFILKQPIRNADRPVFFFLDEIHTLPDWGKEIKGLYDAYHPNLRVLATGSSSAALLNAPTADFPGRIARSHIHPLKFSETLETQAREARALVKLAKETRQLLATFDGSPEHRERLAEALEQLHAEGQRHLPAIERALDAYVTRGGYPAAQPPATDEEAFRFFEATIDTVLSKDLKLYEKVRKPGAFRAFLAKLAKEHGGKFLSASHAKDLGVDKETPATWKVITEELFLVHQLPPLNENFNPIPGRADKAYYQDPGIRAYLTSDPRIDELEASGKIGEVIEGILFDHLRRLQYNTLGHRNGTIGYWDRPEVDFIAQLPRAWLAIEAKYRTEPRGKSRLETHFGEREDVLPIVATRDRFNLEGKAWQMPAWVLMSVA